MAWGQEKPSGTVIEIQPSPAASRTDSPTVAEDRGSDTSSDTAPGAGQRAADLLPTAERADELMPALARIEAAIRDLNAPSGADGGQRRDERDERGLRAQEEIAFWARAMFWAAIGVVALAAIALYAVLRTLAHTRRAAKDIIGEARETTRAMVAATQQASRANDLAGRALGGPNRPHVVPIIVAHNLPKYVTGKSSAEQELTASIIYKNIGTAPAVLRRISPIANTIPASSEPEPLNYFYFNRHLFLELEASYLEPGQATKEIAISCSLPKRVRELAAAQGVSLAFLTEDTAKVVLQDRLTYTDLLGNETVLYVRYDYVLGFFELIQIREERAGSGESVYRLEQARSGAALT